MVAYDPKGEQARYIDAAIDGMLIGFLLSSNNANQCYAIQDAGTLHQARDTRSNQTFNADRLQYSRIAADRPSASIRCIASFSVAACITCAPTFFHGDV